ncbi:Protein PDF [Pseudolycoriella hygida]|uniref:Protein PDF n=1 Tax=Pseudolycoriella hygida TaxID=35572 RepID=A0A9Q0N4C9_9DIPT|nr:Protein PDF [Pseudolycoriella hygida]
MNSKAMVRIPVLILAVLMWCNICIAYVVPGNTTPDDERFFDKEYVRELASFIAALSGSSNSPCHNNYGGYANPMPKRNSELINSLLSLPKTMSDVGK